MTEPVRSRRVRSAAAEPVAEAGGRLEFFRIAGGSVENSREERRRLEFLAYRSMVVCQDILGAVEDAGGEGVRWVDVLALPGLIDRNEGTVDATIRDLVNFGALRVTGSPRRPGSHASRPDGRVLRLTVLGRAWLDEELLPRPADLLGETPKNDADVGT